MSEKNDKNEDFTPGNVTTGLTNEGYLTYSISSIKNIAKMRRCQTVEECKESVCKAETYTVHRLTSHLGAVGEEPERSPCVKGIRVVEQQVVRQFGWYHEMR